MPRPVNTQRSARPDHRRDALQKRHTFAHYQRQLNKHARSHKVAEAPIGSGQEDLGMMQQGLKAALPAQMFVQTLAAAATADTLELPPTKVAGVVLATVASALTAGLPALAPSPLAGGANVAVGGAPHGAAVTPVPPVSAPSVALEAAAAGVEPEASALTSPGRHLLDLSSDIGALAALGDSSFQINDYGSALQTNKQNLVTGVAAAGGSLSVQILAVAVGMLETNHMAGYERDANKDGITDGSKNCSPLNINVHLWNSMGVTDTDWMNSAAVDMVRLGRTFAAGMEVVGLAQFVGFTRVGSNHASPSAQEVTWIEQYKHGLGTVIKQIQADPTLLSDSRRVEVSIPYIG